jgi:7 transmembrane receptor (rhodopsin family).
MQNFSISNNTSHNGTHGVNSNATKNNSDTRSINATDNFAPPTEIAVLCLICVLTILGNLLVIWAYAKGSKKLRTRTNFFVINLAISDLLVGCISLPFWLCLRTGKFIIYLYHIMVITLF